MTVALASTWLPRGELLRFERFFPQLAELYTQMIVVMPAGTDSDIVSTLKVYPQVKPIVREESLPGRYAALQLALKSEATHIQYCDFDRLIHWVETRPDELQQTVKTVQQGDCYIIGRTTAAWQTHPQALRQTEAIVNDVLSYFLGKPLDVCSGSKSFSRAAAQYLIEKAMPENGLNTDSEWAVLLHRAGFKLEPLWVDGLDWETADRYRDSAADSETQKRAAEEHDKDASRWSYRVRVAKDIIYAGLEALTRPL
jgi:hypothetical protein